MTRSGYVRAAAFTQRLGWRTGTVYRKLYKTRKKIENGESLTAYDIPLPDNITKEGVPRWHWSTLDTYAKRYEAAQRGDLLEDLPTLPDSPA